MTWSGGIYLIFREESILSRFNFYYNILNINVFQTQNLFMCFFCLFGKVAYICLFCLIFLTCLNKIPARPQFCNFVLNKDKSSARPPLTVENTLFFYILFARGDLPSSGIPPLGPTDGGSSHKKIFRMKLDCSAGR